MAASRASTPTPEELPTRAVRLPGASAPLHRRDHLGEAVAQQAELVEAHPQSIDALRGNRQRALAQGPPRIRQGDVEGALIAWVALAGQVALRLEALEQGR